MDPHTAEAFAWMIGIAGFWLVVVIVAYLWIARRPRKADRAYHASLRDAAVSYEDEGVHGDVVIVPRRNYEGCVAISCEPRREV